MKRDFKGVEDLCEEIVRLRTGFPFTLEAKRVRRFWLRLMGFGDLASMKAEEIKNLKALLLSRVKALRKKRCFPELQDYLNN